MSKIFLVPVLVAASLAAACSQGPSNDSQDTTSAVRTAVERDVGKVSSGYTPQLLKQPILGFYEPSFPYSVRSQSGAPGKPSGVTLEFWGATTADVHADVDKKLLQLGYKVAKTNSSKGYYITTYQAEGRGDVLVNVAPKGSRKMYAPGTVGTVYFQWSSE